jgi:branched-chain amino acid transport system substrate-binding protein
MVRRRRLATLALAGVLVAHGAAGAGAQPPIKIGEINSYSGVAAAFTAPYKAGVEMAAQELNAQGGVLGRTLEISFRDDKLRPDEAIKHAQELVFQEKVHFLMGTFSSAVGLAVSEFARQNTVMFLAAEPLTETLTWQKGHRYVFRVRPNTWQQGRLLAERAAKFSAVTWANIGPDYEYGHRAWENFWVRLRELKPGVEVVSSSWPKLGAGQYSDHVTKILHANPDAVFTSLFGSDWIAFVKQAIPFGLFSGPRKRAWVGILLGEPEYIDPLGKDVPEGMLVTGYPWYAIDTPAHTAFVARYMQFVGLHHPKLPPYPHLGSLVGYITMLSLAKGIKQAGSPDTDAVIRAMEGLSVDTPIGPISYRPFDHQSTMGAWVGITKLDSSRGVGVMVDWEYVPGDRLLPTEQEVGAMRTGR